MLLTICPGAQDFFPGILYCDDELAFFAGLPHHVQANTGRTGFIESYTPSDCLICVALVAGLVL